MENFNDFEDKAMNFLVKLRNENTFDDILYNEIYNNLEKLTEIWKKQDCIPKRLFLSCVYLTDFLSGGSRFLSEQTVKKWEMPVLLYRSFLSNWRSNCKKLFYYIKY